MLRSLRAWGRLFLGSPARPLRRRRIPAAITTAERRRLRASALALLPRWEAALGVKVAELRLKRMSSRWGTCNFKARRIWLNTELAAKRPELLEYIVVHEMAHLLERSHNADFRAILDRHLPGWRALRRELNTGKSLSSDEVQE